MPRGSGVRFGLEAVFLIAVAVAAGIAALDPIWIVAVMAIAWVLVALSEWAAWRERPRFDARRSHYAWPPPTPVPPLELAPAPPPIELAPIPVDPTPILPPEPEPSLAAATTTDDRGEALVPGEDRGDDGEPQSDQQLKEGAGGPTRRRGWLRWRRQDGGESGARDEHALEQG